MPWSAPVAVVTTQPNIARRARKLWTGAAVVFLVFALACVPIAFISPAGGARLGLIAAGVIWLALAAGSWWYARSGKVTTASDAPISLLSVHTEGVVVGEGVTLPWAQVHGLLVDSFDPGPQRPAMNAGARIADALIEQTLQNTGQSGGLRVVLATAQRGHPLPETGGMIREEPGGNGSALLTITCHPLLVSGDLAATHHALSNLASAAGVKPLTR